MTDNSLEAWSKAVRSSWTPLSSELIARCRRYLQRLLMAPVKEDWIEQLRRDLPASRELYRDPEHGFVLLAHTEPAGLYRLPHDHGQSWVIYGVLHGEVEMGTYARVPGSDGGHLLVKRDSNRMSAGQVQVYLPGDIHDTLCVSGPALLLRFTERDLRIEKEEHRLMRYVQQDGVWMAEAA